MSTLAFAIGGVAVGLLVWFFLARRKAGEPPFLGHGDSGYRSPYNPPTGGRLFRNRRTL